MYFMPMTKDVREVASLMIALAAAGTNHRTATSNYTELLSFELRAVVVCWRVVVIYRGTSILLCGVNLISVVELQFLLYM